MNTNLLKLAFALVASAIAITGFAHSGDTKDPITGEKLGRVLFKTSCSPQAQREFEVARARLHSFHFPETIKAFSAIPQTDPTCAIA